VKALERIHERLNRRIRLKLFLVNFFIIFIGFSILTYSLEKEISTTKIQNEKLGHQIKSYKDKIVSLQNHIETIKKQYFNEIEKSKLLVNKVQQYQTKLKSVTYIASDLGDFTITAYDLSIQSCGKAPNHPQFGITSSGFNLAGKNWKEIKVIAVDPSVIPLGTEVYIEFKEDYLQKYNGFFTAADTGSGVKGNDIDLYLGDGTGINKDVHKETLKFGVRKAKVYSMKKL
jgi:3D (Asp-Asp-Asp) domain-containing protein